MITLLLFMAVLMMMGVAATAFIPPKWSLFVVCATNILQIYTVSLLGIYPSLGLLSALALWPVVFKQNDLWRWPWMWALSALLAAQCFSILWSPDRVLGIRYLIYSLPALFVGLAAYRLTRQSPGFVGKCLRVMVLLGVVQAAMVMVFRFLPQVELAFLSSPAAELLVSKNVLMGLFDGTARNNVFDPGKAGGVFVNSNLAAVYLGMMAMVAWTLARENRALWLRASALICFVAVFCTGSKAGVLSAVAIALALMATSTRKVLNFANLAIGLTVLAGVIGAAAFLVDWDALLQFRSATEQTLGSRTELWHFALREFQHHPILGLGFGGWEIDFLNFAVANRLPNLPPHNSLIILWSQSGLLAALAGIAYVAAVFMAFKTMLTRGSAELREVAACMGAAFAWYVLQGLGENYSLVGEVHMTALVALILGYVCARYDHELAAEQTTHERQGLSWRLAPVATKWGLMPDVQR